MVYRKWKKYLGVADYFSYEEYFQEWSLNHHSEPFRSAIFKRSLSDWIQRSLQSGVLKSKRSVNPLQIQMMCKNLKN